MRRSQVRSGSRSIDAARTRIDLTLDFEPSGVVETAGDKLGIVEAQRSSDLKRFKEFIENRANPTGAWRGSRPTTDDHERDVLGRLSADLTSDGFDPRSGVMTGPATQRWPAPSADLRTVRRALRDAGEDGVMIDVLTAHTADLAPVLLDASRALMYDTFDDMAEDDWEHALGGVHAVVLDDGVVTATARSCSAGSPHGGRPLRAGYVEAVAVRADRQREGHGAALMRELERVTAPPTTSGRSARPTRARCSTRAAAGGCGAARWRSSPSGVLPTPDEQGGVFVLPAAAALDLEGELRVRLARRRRLVACTVRRTPTTPCASGFPVEEAPVGSFTPRRQRPGRRSTPPSPDRDGGAARRAARARARSRRARRSRRRVEAGRGAVALGQRGGPVQPDDGAASIVSRTSYQDTTASQSVSA